MFAVHLSEIIHIISNRHEGLVEELTEIMKLDVSGVIQYQLIHYTIC